jgi:tetratricopeptide (TPR) repeat protein
VPEDVDVDPGAGGYARSPAVEADPAWRADACSIDRRDAADLPAATFRAEYENRRPLILRNATGGAGRRAAFSKARLLARYGSARVKTGISKLIPMAHGDGHYPAMALRDFVGRMSESPPAVAGDPLYLFDRDDFLRRAPELLAGLLALPAALGGTVLTTAAGDGMAFYLAMGGALSGTQFHRHEEGWYAQLFGRKKWLLYPPSTPPPIHYPASQLSVADWLRTLYPALVGGGRGRLPVECTLEGGDLLYVPESWYHATLNLGESVGVAGQRRAPATALQAAWQKAEAAAMSGDAAEGARRHEDVLRLDPVSVEAWHMRGLLLGKSGRTHESIAASERCLALGAAEGAPRGDHAGALDSVGVGLAKLGRAEEAEAAFRRSFEAFPRGVGAATHWAAMLRHLGRSEEAAYATRLGARNAALVQASARGIAAAVVAEEAAAGTAGEQAAWGGGTLPVLAAFAFGLLACCAAHLVVSRVAARRKRAHYRVLLTDVYRKCAPEKLGNVESVLAAYAGHEEAMVVKLQQTYKLTELKST